MNCAEKLLEPTIFFNLYIKVSNGAKIRNRYNQVPHLTQDTNGKVTNSQVDTTNESQEVSPFPAGDHKAHINRHAQNIANTRQNKNIKDPQKKYRLGTVSKQVNIEVKSDMEFRYQFIVSAIKFRKKMFCEVNETDSLVKKFLTKRLLRVLKSATWLDALANRMS